MAERWAREDAWRDSGVPSRHRKHAETVRWEGDDRTAFEDVCAGVRDGGIVALLGPRGRGKTQMVAQIIRHVTLHKGWTAKYRRFADLLSEMRSEAYGDGGSDCRVVQRLSRVGLLAIDELHERRWTDDESLWLGRVMDHRYGEEKPTILIANLTRAEFAQRIGLSVLDRMHQGGCVVEMTGPSRRQSTSLPAEERAKYENRSKA